MCNISEEKLWEKPNSSIHHAETKSPTKLNGADVQYQTFRRRGCFFFSPFQLCFVLSWKNKTEVWQPGCPWTPLAPKQAHTYTLELGRCKPNTNSDYGGPWKNAPPPSFALPPNPDTPPPVHSSFFFFFSQGLSWGANWYIKHSSH